MCGVQNWQLGYDKISSITSSFRQVKMAFAMKNY